MYLLFDIGGTNMRVAVSEDGQTISRTKIVPTPQDFDKGIQTLKQLATRGKITAIAGCIAGPLDKEKTKMVKSPHLPGWVNKPLKQVLGNDFNVPVLLENDSALVGLGEAVYGSGKDHDVIAYIGIGTGIGGVRIVSEKIDSNVLGFEPGHQIIEIDGKLCNCGGKGHLEAYVGGYYLEKEYGKPAKDISDPAIWDKVAKYLSVGLNNTIVHWSPDIVVLGGSVMQKIPIDKLEIYLKENLTIFPKPPRLALAKLGSEGGLYGALSLL